MINGKNRYNYENTGKYVKLSHCHGGQKSTSKRDYRKGNVQADTVRIMIGNPLVRNLSPMGRTPQRGPAARVNHGAGMPRYIITEKTIVRGLPQMALGQTFRKKSRRIPDGNVVSIAIGP